ncbi:Crp/Fnr family transcriptional regulator [Jannaschia sp. KMU-145]
MSELIDLFADARRSDVAAGQILFRRDDPVTTVHLVRDGAVALERPLADGGHLTLHVASAGTLLAEASLFAPRYHCDAVMRIAGTVLSLERGVLMDRLMADPTTTARMLQRAALEIQALRGRVELMRLKRLSDRLDGWLELHGPPERGGWKAVADGIGVTPAALYRELARRRS